MLTRRQVLKSTAVATGATVGGTLVGAGVAQAFDDATGPFALGVASGDPLSDRVILWTRLVGAKPLPAKPIEVSWQVATDERFKHVARSGTTHARPELGHSVHVDAIGLASDHVYYYRFKALGEHSPVGRTKTAPRAGQRGVRLRFGVVNCQDFQAGYWSAYAGLNDEDLDLVVHLGDYIYETDPDSQFADRVHTAPAPGGLGQLRTLADYRARHEQYKSDQVLRLAHAQFPWIATWDDHDTGLTDPLADRAAAYQAYYEHMPIRATFAPGDTGLRMHRRLDWGSLARFTVLDTEQHRTSSSLIGDAQEQWLVGGLRGSNATWNVIAQPPMLAKVKLPAGVTGLDEWDAYETQRARLVRGLSADKVANPVVLSGDLRSTWLSELKWDFDRPESPSVGVEFAAPSVSTTFPAEYDAAIKQANGQLNPQVKYFDGLQHGYLRCEVDGELWRTCVRTVKAIDVRQAPVNTPATFVVEAGRSTLQKS